MTRITLIISLLALGACGSAPPIPTLAVGSEPVVLLHALARRPKTLAKLEKRLTEAGFQVVNLGYPSIQQNIESLSHGIAKQIESCCAQAKRMNFVTHSLGGIVLRQYVNDYAPNNIYRVVMLAPPNQGSEVADRWFLKPLMWIAGPAARQLGTRNGLPKTLGPINFQLGVIAGNRSRNPLFSLAIPGSDDGAVAVSSTQHEDMVDFLLLEKSHSRLAQADMTATQVIHFLNHGAFLH